MFTRQMAMKSLGLAAIALGCSMGIAVAAPTAPTKQQMELLKAAVAERAGNGVAQTAGAPATGAKGVKAAIVLGWNFFHATNCGWFVDGSGGQWFYIFPSEGGIWFTINNLYTSQGLQISCGDGNFFGVFVVNTSTGAFNQTISYTFK